ncbi:MAG: hypothetical protein ACK2T7_04330 [Anaerolineales bacterium]
MYCNRRSCHWQDGIARWRTAIQHRRKAAFALDRREVRGVTISLLAEAGGLITDLCI